MKIKPIWWAGAIVLLVATRFIGLDWGLPYPFHPDERNIAVAIATISPREYFHPHFFAYGQLSIYAAYLLSVASNILAGKSALIISPDVATLALRAIAAAAAVAAVWVSWKIVVYLIPRPSPILILLFVFSPALIQFAHFGTTESVLMLCYVLMIYHTLQQANDKLDQKERVHHFLWSAFWVGVASAAKISSLIFALLPVAVYLFSLRRIGTQKIVRSLLLLAAFGALVVCTTLLLSPYNALAWSEFLGALRYESEIARGLPVFYTRSFQESIPLFYQFFKIFPYALGWPATILFIVGFFALPFTKKYNILRFAFLLYFIPSAFLYAKWTRFVAPVLPLAVILATLFIQRFVKNIILMMIITMIAIIPGMAYLSIYARADVRFAASEWMYENIPKGSYILSETANVVDLPVDPPHTSHLSHNYQYISFNFYDVDENPVLQKELTDHVARADYIFVLSRRVYANHTCEIAKNYELRIMNEEERCRKLQTKYPILNDYYRKLFSGELGFTKVAEFSSFPQLSIFNFQFSISDEQSEETWTVFDHPVVRIYKKV